MMILSTIQLFKNDLTSIFNRSYIKAITIKYGSYMFDDYNS